MVASWHRCVILRPRGASRDRCGSIELEALSGCCDALLLGRLVCDIRRTVDRVTFKAPKAFVCKPPVASLAAATTAVSGLVQHQHQHQHHAYELQLHSPAAGLAARDER